MHFGSSYRTEDPASADLPPRWRIIKYDEERSTVRMHDGSEIQYHGPRSIQSIEIDCWNTWKVKTGLSKKKMKKLLKALDFCEKIANDEPYSRNCEPFTYLKNISEQALAIISP